MNQNLNRNKNSEFSYSPHPLVGLLSHQLFRLCYQPRSDLVLYNIGFPNTFYKYFFRSLIFILIAAFLPRFCSDRLIYPYLSNKQEISENKKRVTFCVKWPGQGREIDLMVNSKCKKIYTKTEVTLCHLGQHDNMVDRQIPVTDSQPILKRVVYFYFSNMFICTRQTWAIMPMIGPLTES